MNEGSMRGIENAQNLVRFHCGVHFEVKRNTDFESQWRPNQALALSVGHGSGHRLHKHRPHSFLCVHTGFRPPREPTRLLSANIDSTACGIQRQQLARERF
jgi:hypothetical protein